MFYLIEILMAFILIFVGYKYWKLSKLKVHNEILFSFCDRRRELMNLAREGKIDVRSDIFKFLYGFMSNLIRYTREFRFLSDYFLKIFYIQGETIPNNKDRYTLSKSAEEQGKEAIDLMDGFMDDLLYGFIKADPLFLVKYKILKDNINKRKMKFKNPKAQNFYNEITAWHTSFGHHKYA